MPALAIYKGTHFRVSWLGKVKEGPHAGERRAKLIPLKGGNSTPIWVDGGDIVLVDNKVKGGGEMTYALVTRFGWGNGNKLTVIRTHPTQKEAYADMMRSGEKRYMVVEMSEARTPGATIYRDWLENNLHMVIA